MTNRVNSSFPKGGIHLPLPKKDILENLHFAYANTKENKADRRLCYRYIDSTIPLLSKSDISSPSHIL